jgi:signal peptidase II
VTKHVAATTLSEASSRSFLADTFRLEYVENTGAFLGLGADWPLPVRTAVFGVGMGCFYLPWPSSPCGVAGPDGLSSASRSW